MALAGLPATIHAQRVTGRVLDRDTSEPVSYALLTLIAVDSSQSIQTRAGSGGHFSIEAPPGRYSLAAERYGYAPTKTEIIGLPEGEVVTVVVRMSAEGIQLDALEVIVRGSDERGRDGFARRRTLGKGVFLTPDSIRLRNPVVASDALYGVPGVSILDPGYGQPIIWSATGQKCLKIFLDHHTKPIQEDRPLRGRALAYLPKPQEFGLNTFVDVAKIKGIEVYRDFSEVPMELRTAMRVGDLLEPRGAPIGAPRQLEPCGFAWVWTDTGWD